MCSVGCIYSNVPTLFLHSCHAPALESYMKRNGRVFFFLLHPVERRPFRTGTAVLICVAPFSQKLFHVHWECCPARTLTCTWSISPCISTFLATLLSSRSWPPFPSPLEARSIIPRLCFRVTLLRSSLVGCRVLL